MMHATLSKPIQSMTGYATASADSPRGRLSIELRSVNARFLDLQFRIADELRGVEPTLRELIGARLARGKIDCRFFFNEASVAAKRERLNAEALVRLKSLAAEAQAAGLLAPKQLERMLREALRAKRVEKLAAVREVLAANPLPPMTPEEIQAEIDAYRAEVRRAAGT